MTEHDMVHLIVTTHSLSKKSDGTYINPKTEDLIAYSLSSVSLLRKVDTYYGKSYWDEVERQIMTKNNQNQQAIVPTTK